MSLTVGYFDRLYAAAPDPWNFEGSGYERAKYDATLAALPRARYRNAVELGCSIGVLTARLGLRCDRLLAIDGAEAALRMARRRCRELPQIEIRAGWVPKDWPGRDAPFDLILLSEMLYYLDADDITRLAGLVLETAAPAADILAVHWTGETDYPMSGDAAVGGFTAAMGSRAQPLRRERHPLYRLDVLRTVAPAWR